MKDTPSKNRELADDFHTFCKENPNLRFWQALQAWGGHGWIFISDSPKIREDLTMNDLEDVYYREGK